MGSVKRRLKILEEQAIVSENELRRVAYRMFYERLTYEELSWLSEPDDQAQERVACPHVESIECMCRGAERQMRGFEAYPELYEEYARRYRILYERREEILARAPEDPATTWKRHYDLSS